MKITEDSEVARMEQSGIRDSVGRAEARGRCYNHLIAAFRDRGLAVNLLGRGPDHVLDGVALELSVNVELVAVDGSFRSSRQVG